ncbi:MAG: dTDP-4-amino-4,6-dideoxygalactose transaminase [Deltaproteobacteria bacterium]|nr:dTDP-4-amino-4,6-dideoxygalactose transaminase [Deltaproteobacteria bacterium]MBW2397349.1 dTDP-4-amino-4,6-dideoxygalactose transaminase [Deltaproteobacteria bacterium]
MYRIPFAKPFIVGKELRYMAQAVTLGNIAADGHFTRECSEFLEGLSGSPRVLMTPSCTSALEMAALLCRLEEGDEVILPSYTFVSTANCFVHSGARPVFVDVRPDTLNLDESLIEEAVTPRTRAIFVVHYAGVSCEMDPIMEIAKRHGLRVVEDAAQGVNATYHGRPLGGIGDLGTYSFHETKNFTCGEGGALCINDPELVARAEIIRDKGTNRQAFNRGEIGKYTWVDHGSSHVPSELSCAFLLAQLEQMDLITQRRREVYERYLDGLTPLGAAGVLILPKTPPSCEINYHMFQILLADTPTRSALIDHLKQRGILAVFHYVPLHLAPMGRRYGWKEGDLPVTEEMAGRLLRLPFYFELSAEEQDEVIGAVREFFENRS